MGSPMLTLDTALVVVTGVALFAAFVNGALGYGFSSLTVPLALVFYTNRLLNPAVVLIEVLINFYVLVDQPPGVPAVWRRVLPILIGLLPGIGLGALLLTSLQPGWVKLVTYVVILPLILVQAAGWRRPIQLDLGGRAAVRRRARRALFADDHLGPAARDAVQQPGPGEERVPRRPRAGARRRVEPDRDRLLAPRPVHAESLALLLAFWSRRADRHPARRLWRSGGWTPRRSAASA